jgi:hypothetical protein
MVAGGKPGRFRVELALEYSSKMATSLQISTLLARQSIQMAL